MCSYSNKPAHRKLFVVSIFALAVVLALLPASWQAATYAENVLAISINYAAAPPSPPTNISLSSNTVADNSLSQTTVGTFSTTDPDSSAFTYSLVAYTVPESIDNGSFIIANGVLKTTGIFDFETKSTYGIRVRSTDETGLFFEKQFTINVIDGPDSLISFSSPTYSVNETDGNATITLTRTGVPNNPAVAKLNLTDVTTSSADYRFVPGAVDTSFNPTCPGTVTALAVQTDGKVLVGSTASIGITRFIPDGSADSSFAPDSAAVIGGGVIGLQPDGKIIVSSYVIGGTTRRPARLNSDGSLDTSFDPGVGTDGGVTAVAIQPDGKIIVVGAFTKYNGVNRTRIARTNSDGSLDTSFDPGLGPDATVFALALRPDGKIVIGGDFNKYDGFTRTRVARLNPNGSVDNGFFPISSPVSLKAIALQPDGKVIAGGIGTVARMNPDGSVDATFTTGALTEIVDGVSFAGLVNQIAIQADGKIIVGGLFMFSGTTRGDNLFRFNANGSVDTSFKPPIGSFGPEPPGHPPGGPLTLQPDGRIIVSSFRALNSAGRGCLARLGGDVFINWAAGESADKTVLLPIVDDGIPEPNETLTLSIVPLSGGAVVGANPNATLTIINAHDKASVAISAVSGSGIYRGTATLTATLTSGGTPLSGKAINFRFYFTDRTGTTDANGVATLINVPLTGYNSATCFCPSDVAPGSYSVVASFAGDADYLAGSNSGTAIISKAATTTTVSSSANPSLFGQDVTFTATVTSAAGTPTGKAQFKVDGANSGAAVDLNGSGIATLSTSSLTTGSHTINVDYSGDANFAVSSSSTLTQVVFEQLMSFSQSNYDTSEGSGFVTITVNRSGLLSNPVTADYATNDQWAPDSYDTVNGWASARCDFGTAMGTLKFAPGETQKTFQVLVNRDSYTEGPELFTINLSNLPANASLATPSTATVTIADDTAGMPPNTLDDPRIFVQTHYHDFLNREADPGGLDFWTKEVTSCGADAQCIEVKRINVSASFFLSIEFQDTGYLVERLYKVAYGDVMGTSTLGGPHQLVVPIVRLDEFLPDTQSISQGVIVNQPNWQQQLQNNKQAFAAEFVQRSRFTTAFPASMTMAQFVDQLNTNAGNPLSQSERDQLVNSGMTRAQMLLTIAENRKLYNAELNRAFVLMEYFGYLRRNPNNSQDTDYTGYDFWLTKLSQFNGNFVNAEMVKAFITSGEYRDRFGPN